MTTAVKYELYGEIGVLTLEGDLAGEAASNAATTLDQKLTSGAVRLIIDLTKTESLDSVALQAISTSAHRCRLQGGRLILAGVNNDCRKILEMTRLDRRLEICANAEAAMKSIRLIGESRRASKP